MFFLDDDAQITRIAGSLAEWMDYDIEALIGQPITTIVSAEDTGPVEVALTQVQETQTAQTIACHFLVGTDPVPVEVEFTPVASEADLGTIMGTVERESVPAAEPSAQLVELLNYIELLEDPAVVCSISENVPIVEAVNAAFETKFGYQSEQLLGDSLNDYIVPRDRQNEARQFAQQIAAGTVSTAIVERKTANGIQKFSYRGLPVEDTNGCSHAVAIYSDISEEQQAKEHVEVLHRVLRHNVRNELTVILGMADEIRKETNNTDVQNAVERIVARAEDLATVSEKARIAEDILDEGASDAVIEAGSVATDVVTEARETWPDAAIEIDVETPLPVATGEGFRDALENLIENAITHNTGSPAVRVTASTETPIQVSTRESGQNAVITVADNGPGIPETEQAVVFENEDISQLKHGGGLGLWVVRWIVESANGTLSYDRADGWTTITIRLPLVADGDSWRQNNVVK